MTGLHEFIIEVKKPLSDTFKTESGVELYAHKRFSVDRLSNRVAKVISSPIFHETPIEPGYEVMIEPTIFHKQIYREVTQDYTNLVDSENMWFRVMPSMIILYRKDEDDDWKGYLENVLVEPIAEEKKKLTSSLIIVPETTNTYKPDRVKLTYNNDKLKELGVNEGDELVINPIGGLKFWIEGKEFWWVRNNDVYAIAV